MGKGGYGKGPSKGSGYHWNSYYANNNSDRAELQQYRDKQREQEQEKTIASTATQVAKKVSSMFGLGEPKDESSKKSSTFSLTKAAVRLLRKTESDSSTSSSSKEASSSSSSSHSKGRFLRRVLSKIGKDGKKKKKSRKSKKKRAKKDKGEKEKNSKRKRDDKSPDAVPAPSAPAPSGLKGLRPDLTPTPTKGKFKDEVYAKIVKLVSPGLDTSSFPTMHDDWVSELASRTSASTLNALLVKYKQSTNKPKKTDKIEQLIAYLT